ncbi:MAG: hypothetical protein IJA89_04410 [Clostridia bacterium]|nr:hypothetical protein [Clostridia bacterium]
MKKYLLPEKGAFYKANMHVHTTVSDGKDSPEEIKRIYKEKGYSIVAYTDHEVLVPHDELCDENFVAITAVEIGNHEDARPKLGRNYHLNLYAKTPLKDFFSMRCSRYVKESWGKWESLQQKEIEFNRVYGVEGTNEIVAKANEEGFLVCYNHPVWSGQTAIDYLGLEGLWGIEVFNATCVRQGKVDNDNPLKDLLHTGKQVFPVAADDAHGPLCYGVGWIQVKAEWLDYTTVMQALEKGNFYASTGPEIKELYVEGTTLHIETSPCKSVYVYTDNPILLRAVAEEGQFLESAEIDVSVLLEKLNLGFVGKGKNEMYIRIVVTDELERKAYTRAYYLREVFD